VTRKELRERKEEAYYSFIYLFLFISVPCESTSSTVQCEMDPQSQVVAREALAARGLLVVGWYHSHPAFAPCPSIRGILSFTHAWKRGRRRARDRGERGGERERDNKEEYMESKVNRRI
jgi:Prokaryotic homologs of the JAB domain